MRIPRIYTLNELAEQRTVSLEPKAHKHLKDVLRMSKGDQVILFNGDGNDYLGCITEISKKILLIDIHDSHTVNNESPLTLHLLQPLCSSEKMDLCLQKATELGVNEITPFISSRVNINISSSRLEKKMQHWQAVIKSACEQSGRAHLPIIHSPSFYSDALNNTHQTDIKIIASPEGKQSQANKFKQASSCVCAIGPEGGFSLQEIQIAEQLGFNALKIGGRILRLETAVIAIVTLCQFNWGDFK